MQRLPYLFTAALLVLALAAGCDNDETGEIAVSAYGEDYAEVGVAPPKMEDGWTITFDRFVVALEDITVGGVDVPNPDPVDLSNPSDGQGHPVATVTVPAGEHSRPAYSITSLEIAGSAVRDDTTKTFDWTFEGKTRFSNCEITTVVPADGSAGFEITIHVDHLFVDSLVSEDPGIFFDALAAADTDGDGVITREELAATGIGSYDPGNEDISNLWDWLVATTRVIGHADGEEHCEAEVID